MTEKAEGTENSPGTLNWTANEEGVVDDLVLVDDVEYDKIAKQSQEDKKAEENG